MNLFQSNNVLLSRASPVKPGKRFVSFFIDFLIVFLISYLVFLGAFEITKNTTQYKSAGQVINDEIAYYVDLAEDSHIVEYLEKDTATRKDYDMMVIENCNRAIYRSYLVFGNAQEPNFIIDDNHAVTKYGKATLESDNVSYFYTKYIPNNPDRKIVDFDGKSPTTFLNDLYKNAFGENKSMFTFDSENADIPTLNTQSAYYLFCYLYNQGEESQRDKGSDYYVKYYNAYEYMLSEAENLLIKSEPYFTQHYLVYRDSYYNQGRYINLTLIASVMVGYLIAILIPKILFKNERTIGRLIMGLGLLTIDNKHSKWYTILFKSILGMVGFVTVISLVYFLPPFNGIYDFMMMPLFANSSNFNLLSLIFILILITGALYVSTLFTHYRTSLIDILFKEKLVDKKYIDEGDNDEHFEARPY